ncbi:hypothetical protein [Planococcus shixiaomingii]|uniref:hypothetical protein n=1 Tax=Planococcus shixiaomingii TaxID=3058393 RepID=UPI002611220A|nr:hypothetical protein [Planococcus sp. N022]WKA53815.1 hypothetical protein QWY21_14235 [Planococcus sp. N022]
MIGKERIFQAAEKAAELLQATFNLKASECQIKKNRTFTIYANQVYFTCTLDFSISFEQMTDTGYAFNKAEILLLPEEFPAFSFTLKEHAFPLPVNCQQKLTANTNLISYYIETMEPPEHFASRLSAAFKTIEPLENHAISLY